MNINYMIYWIAYVYFSYTIIYNDKIEVIMQIPCDVSIVNAFTSNLGLMGSIRNVFTDFMTNHSWVYD